MAGEVSHEATKLWSEGPHIWGVDPKVIPHFSFYAVCNDESCQETFPFAVGLGEQMRKHYNAKHRLYCKACKKGDFNNRSDLEIHLCSVHKDSLCFMCHTSFDLPTALAMHIESPKSTCYVPQFDLVSALRYFQMKHHGVTDPKAVFSPLSCCPGDQTVQKLKEYRKTLLLAHKKAVSDKQEIEYPPSPASPLGMHSVGYTTSVYSFGNTSDSSIKLPPKFSGKSNEPVGFQTTLVQNMSKELPTRSEQENDDSFSPSVWTCSTCVGTKFSSLSKLLQHVEAKAMKSLFKCHFN